MNMVIEGFLKGVGKNIADWFSAQAHDAVKEWSKPIYDFISEYKYCFVCTALLIGLIYVLVKCCCIGFFPQGQFIKYTCCLLIVFVLGVFIGAICRRGENARPIPDLTRTTEADNEDNLPTQNEKPSPEDRSTSQKENERLSPGQSDDSDTIDIEQRNFEEGSFVLLFKNVIKDNAEKEVSLFVNDIEDPTLVLTFKIVNGDFTKSWMKDNYKKIFMDAKSNLWIADFDEHYARKYYIQSS